MQGVIDYPLSATTTESETDMAGKFQMYSQEGSDAVEVALQPVLDQIKALRVSLDDVYAQVAREGYPEVYDTEPRSVCRELIEQALRDIEFIW